jgi:hypothetical protein
MCAGLATLADLASPVPEGSPRLSLALVSAKVAGSVLEAGGKADELLAGEREAAQLSHPANFPGKLSVALPVRQQPIRVSVQPFWQKPVAQSLGAASDPW